MWDAFKQTIGVMLAKLVMGAVAGLVLVLVLWLLLRNAS